MKKINVNCNSGKQIGNVGASKNAVDDANTKLWMRDTRGKVMDQQSPSQLDDVIRGKVIKDDKKQKSQNKTKSNRSRVHCHVVQVFLDIPDNFGLVNTKSTIDKAKISLYKYQVPTSQ